MPIRKGNLWRICKKCGKHFEPSGKFERYCDNCKPQGFSWINQLAKRKGHRTTQKPLQSKKKKKVRKST